MGTTQQEFKDLCYLLTCKSILDVPSCRDWEGVMSSREKLIEQFHTVLFEFEGENLPDARGVVAPAPPNRLTSLLSQAVQHQIANNHYHPKTTPTIASLLHDYRTCVVPNAARRREHSLHPMAVFVLDSLLSSEVRGVYERVAVGAS